MTRPFTSLVIAVALVAPAKPTLTWIPDLELLRSDEIDDMQAGEPFDPVRIPIPPIEHHDEMCGCSVDG